MKAREYFGLAGLLHSLDRSAEPRFCSHAHHAAGKAWVRTLPDKVREQQLHRRILGHIDDERERADIADRRDA